MYIAIENNRFIILTNINLNNLKYFNIYSKTTFFYLNYIYLYSNDQEH